MSNNIMNFNMDNIPCETIAQVLATTSYATMKLKDCGVSNDDMFSILTIMFGMEVEFTNDALKDQIDGIIDVADKLAKLSGGDINTIIRNAVEMGKNRNS